LQRVHSLDPYGPFVDQTRIEEHFAAIDPF